MALSMGEMLITDNSCFFAALPALALQDCDCFRIPNRPLGKAIDPGVEANEAIFDLRSQIRYFNPGVKKLQVQCFYIPLHAEQQILE